MQVLTRIECSIFLLTIYYVAYSTNGNAKCIEGVKIVCVINILLFFPENRTNNS